MPAVATEQLVVLGTAATALVAVLHNVTWRVTRTVVTIAHEGGHAVVALLAGRRLDGIRVHADTSGLTVTAGRARGLGLVLTLLAGYPAPSVLGLGAAALVTTGHEPLLLWLAVGLLVTTLVAVRNAYGVLAVVVTGGTVGAVSWYGTTTTQAVVASVLTWFLLFGGLRSVHELRSRRRTQASDVDKLARLTTVPAVVWLTLFALVALGAVAAGAWLLVGPLDPLLIETAAVGPCVQDHW